MCSKIPVSLFVISIICFYRAFAFNPEIGKENKSIFSSVEKNEKEVKEKKIEFGYNFGISLTTLRFIDYSDHHNIRNYLKLNNSVFPTLGCYLNSYVPNTKKHISFTNELTYTYYSFNTMYNETRLDGSFTNRNISYGNLYANLNSMIRLYFGSNTIKWYVNAGIANGLLLYYKDKIKIQSFYFNQHQYTNSKLFYFKKEHEFSWLTGFGLKLPKFELELRYQKGNGATKPIIAVTNTHRLFLLCHIKLL